jgi:hypothetical protein
VPLSFFSFDRPYVHAQHTGVSALMEWVCVGII